MLKGFLLEEPVLKYRSPDQPYVLYTDASKYAWAGVLMQAYRHAVDGVEKEIHHPITYVSGLFRGPQINWAALVKEAYLFTWPPESSIITFQIQIPQFTATTCRCIGSY